MSIKSEFRRRLMSLAVSPSGFTFDPQTGCSYTLNETGLEVLEGLRRGCSREELTQSLSREYDILPERVEAALDHFVAHLERSLAC